MSQVVHKLCELVVKYDAVIALEDLNSGFKNSRVKVEKQVYQKFEKALIDKLNYLVTSKDPADAEQPGGLLHAYQLTNKADKTAHGLQNGILFYVPAWLTSKIDPVTGFVDLLKPRYQSVHQAQDFFSRFTSVRYHAQEDLFAFTFDYANFPRCGADARRVWTVWTNGERIRTFRDKQSGQFVNETVQLTAAFRALFEKYGFNLEKELLPQITANTDAGFHKALLHLFALTLQMRNSETGNVDVDYLISPVKGPDGTFFDSRNYKGHGGAAGGRRRQRRVQHCAQGSVGNRTAARGGRHRYPERETCHLQPGMAGVCARAMSETPISISNLNDFIFCPVSI